MMNIDLPIINPSTPESEFEQLYKYVYKLAEQLKWENDAQFQLDSKGTEQLAKALSQNSQFSNIVNQIAKGGIADYVVKAGKSGIWHYEKWKSGKIKLWAFDVRHDIYPEFTDGTIYRKADIRFLFPIDLGIKEIQYINSTASGNTTMVWAGQHYVTPTDKGLCLSVDAVFATQTTANVQFYLEAIGKC